MCDFMEDKKVWKNRTAFLFAMIGAAVGLGNIWRYPYVAYTNGGGTFLIPYLCAILILGIPYMLLEYGIGFKFKNSLANILNKINSKFEIIGWFISFIPFLVLTYYICIIGWDIIYIILSLFKGWGSNPNTFFSTTLLHISPNLSGMTDIIWPIVISLVFLWGLVWIITHLDINKGIGKVSEICIPLLFIIMGFIIIFSFTLPGASIGIKELITPNWNMLLDANIWSSAFSQILFSLSLGISVIISYTSYLPDDSKLINNGLLVVLINCGFELITAFGIFSILGYMAISQGVPVNNVVSEGSGLVFITIPTVLNIMGTMGYIIGPLFFLCFFFAGITTTISYIEPMILSISKKFNISRKLTSGILCSIGFVISLIFATGSGNYILTIFDSFLNSFGVFLGIIILTIIFGWYYNLDKILETINNNSKLKMGRLWKFAIKFLIPVVLFLIWIAGLYKLFNQTDTTTLIIEVIISVFLFVIPLILTKLKPRSDNENTNS